MITLDPETVLDVECPWHRGNQFTRQIKSLVDVDSVLLAIIEDGQSSTGHPIHAAGWPKERLANWHKSVPKASSKPDASGASTKIVKRVKKKGSLASDRDLLIVREPNARVLSSSWLMILGRKKYLFSPKDERLAGTVLRSLQSRFSLPQEIGLRRFLVDNELRPLATDAQTEFDLISDPAYCQDVTRVGSEILDQRFGSLSSKDMHDAVVELESEVSWLGMRNLSVSEAKDTVTYVELRHVEDIPSVGLLDDPRISQTLAYLHAHVEQTPSLATLAKAANMSAFHFHRLFTTKVGTTPKQYLLLLQLEVGKLLLRATTSPVGQIAEETGFSSHGHFTSTFHRMAEMTPTEYRETNLVLR